MRIIVYGVGAIGGTIAAALAQSGQPVVGIARGAQLDAIRQNGLRLRAPAHDFVAQFPCVASPAEIDWRPDDAILLCMKTQNSEAALDALRDAGVAEQPIFCVQNGVATERMALRRFQNVHGVTVMMPVTYLTPGEVTVWVEPRFGVLELGRYPFGSDAVDTALAACLEAANIAGFVVEDVMAGKHGKLLLSLRNILRAALGAGKDQGVLSALVQDEAKAVYAAAGIAWRDVGKTDPRRKTLMRRGVVAGLERGGGSTDQSLERGTGSIETDYFNGEVALLGRLHGVATPINAALSRLGAQLVREGRMPGSMTLEQLMDHVSEDAPDSETDP